MLLSSSHIQESSDVPNGPLANRKIIRIIFPSEGFGTETLLNKSPSIFKSSNFLRYMSTFVGHTESLSGILSQSVVVSL